MTTRLASEAMPTTRQGATLVALGAALGTGHRTARQLHVRSDVLWRMEEAGWVARNLHEQWRITGAGREALERWRRDGT